jgi:type 1 glutamine amidotransferase
VRPAWRASAGLRKWSLGIKVREPKSGTLYMQDSGGWYKKTDRGSVFYFMAGHTGHEFENPAYSQILVNTVSFKP